MQIILLGNNIFNTQFKKGRDFFWKFLPPPLHFYLHFCLNEQYHMGLPSLFSSAAPDSPRKLFLALLISERALQASLWEVVGQEIVILERSQIHPYKDVADCVFQTDKVLQELGKQSENVDEIIFGLEPTWVDKDGILDLKKPFLKKITDDLSLHAVGFVVTVEALIQDLAQTQPGQSSIFIDFSQTDLHVSILKQGKLLGSKRVGKSGDTVADVSEGLARFKVEQTDATLPLKIMLFSLFLSESELSTEEQALINHDWVAAQALVQPPIIEVESPHFLLDVITRQGGRAVAQSLGLIEKNQVAAVKTLPGEASSFGIPMAQSPTSVVEPSSVVTPSSVVAPGSLMAAGSSLSAGNKLPGAQEITSEFDDDDDDERPPSKVSQLLARFPRLQNFLSNSAHKPFILGGFLLGILVLATMGYFFLVFSARAVVTVELKTNTIAKDVVLTLDPAATEPNPSGLILPAQVTKQAVMGSDSLASSGTKLVGDPAKGGVTIFNKSTAEKTFAKGTTLKSGKYTFTLDAEVSVASASVTAGSGSETKTFGKADATITATQIGEESNLGEDQEFTIATFDASTYSATNETALSGGVSREVRVVSAADRSNLERTVRALLLQDAAAKFKAAADPGQYVVPSGRLDIKTQTYSAKVDEEVNQVTLEMVGEAEGLGYRTADLQPLAALVLASEVPAGYQLLPEALQILSTPDAQATSSAKIKIDANLSSQVRPDITAEKLMNELAGQSIAKTQEKILNMPEVTSVDVAFQPPLARGFLRNFPPSSRVQVVIK